MHKSPTLRTARLNLTQLIVMSRRNVEWLNNKTVTKFSELRHKNHTINSGQKWLWATTHVWSINVITDVDSSVHIGNIAAYLDASNSVANLSILVGEQDFWGKGYGLEAWNAVLDWLPYRKVEAGCMSCNHPMMKIMDRSSMEYEGTIRDHFMLDGKPVSLIHFGRVK